MARKRTVVGLDVGNDKDVCGRWTGISGHAAACLGHRHGAVAWAQGRPGGRHRADDQGDRRRGDARRGGVANSCAARGGRDRRGTFAVPQPACRAAAGRRRSDGASAAHEHHRAKRGGDFPARRARDCRRDSQDLQRRPSDRRAGSARPHRSLPQGRGARGDGRHQRHDPTWNAACRGPGARFGIGSCSRWHRPRRGLTEDQRREGAAVVDIGGGTTDVAIYVGDACWHIAVLPMGGRARDVGHRARSAAAAAGGRGPQDPARPRRIPMSMPTSRPSRCRDSTTARRSRFRRRDLAQVIDARMEEIFTHVKDENRAQRGITTCSPPVSS